MDALAGEASNPSVVTRIPTEIWNICWTIFHDREEVETLFSVSLACRMFRSSILPLLYRNLSFHFTSRDLRNEDGKDLSEKGLRKINGLCELGHSQLAPLVHSFTLRGPEFADESEINVNPTDAGVALQQVARLLIHALSSFSSLSTVFIFNTVVCEAMIRSLQDIPHLDELLLDFVDFDHSPDVQMNLRVLRLVSHFTNRAFFDPSIPFALCSSASLQSLHLDFGADKKLLRSLMEIGPCVSLIKLKMRVGSDSIHDILAFLRQCPQLKVFKARTRYDRSIPDITFDELHLPPNSIPLLQSYRGPAQFAPLFLPNRSLQKLKITAIQDTDNYPHGFFRNKLLSLLSSYGRHLLKLGLPRLSQSDIWELMSRLPTLCPELRFLDLKADERDTCSELVDQQDPHTYAELTRRLHLGTIRLPIHLELLRIVEGTLSFHLRPGSGTHNRSNEA